MHVATLEQRGVLHRSHCMREAIAVSKEAIAVPKEATAVPKEATAVPKEAIAVSKEATAAAPRCGPEVDRQRTGCTGRWRARHATALWAAAVAVCPRRVGSADRPRPGAYQA